MTHYPLLSRLGQKGTDFLGTPYPIIAGAMASISTHKLVSALAQAGVFPFLAGGALDCEKLRQEILQTKQQTTKPFGVNLIVMHPDLKNLAKVCVEEKVSHVVLAGGIPSDEVIAFLKEGNVKVLCFAPSAIIGRKLVRSGADALIIEGGESGGHIGPVSTIVLMQEVLPFVGDVPVFVAGGIGTGAMIAACLLLGAAGCQLGTTFVATQECPVHENFKKAYFKASSRNAVQTVQLSASFPVIPVRSLDNNAHKEFAKFQLHVISEYEKGALSLEDARMQIEHFWAGSLRKAIEQGNVEEGSVMAGQIVGLVKKETTASACVERLVDETEKTLENMQRLLS